MAPKRIKVSPGKKQSQFAFYVGIGFVLIGLFIAIPTFGPFGIFWTAIAGFICYSHFRNGFSNEKIPSYEIDIEDDDSIEARLKQLENLYNQRLITEEEYQNKRQQILNEI